MTDGVQTLGIDPGKLNTWYTLWEGSKLRRSGHLITPGTVNDLFSGRFRKQVRKWLKHLGLVGGRDELAIERYQHRSGSGGNVSEVMNGIIFVIMAEAQRLGIATFAITPSAHKNSLKRFHTAKYPLAVLKKLGDKHGKWRPKLKRMDPCLHVMDSGSVGFYRILKRGKQI